MKKLFAPVILPLLLTLSAFAGVDVVSPSNGSTVGSPVKFVATASTSCSRGVASIGIYTAPYKLAHVNNGSSLNTSLSLSPGTYHATVEEWDNCGGASTTPVTISVNDKAGVFVTSPSNNSTVTSPVKFTASATTSCAAGVAAMGIYSAPFKKAFAANGTSLNTALNLAPGTYHTTVEEWDKCGGASATPVTVTVSGDSSKGNTSDPPPSGGKTFTNLQDNKGWIGYGELPPNYDICTGCSTVTWSVQHGVSSPSMSGRAAKFNLGGSRSYADALWNNHVIGDGSTQGLPDTSHALAASLHNFTYDVYFYSGNIQLAEALEFDIGQFFNNKGYMYGTECRVTKGDWAIWDNINKKWVSANIPCKAVSNSWNHLVLKVQRTSDNQLKYVSIALNGITYTLNKTYSPYSTPGWHGVVVNFQLDGNSSQTDYSVYVDKLNLTYN
jgi:hypothetical protein